MRETKVCRGVTHLVSRWVEKKNNKKLFAMSQVQVDSPSVMESIVVGAGGVGSRIASPTSTASALPALLHLQVPPATITPAASKRSNFSISNLLATEEEKKTTESNDKQPRLSERDDDLQSKSSINDGRIMIQPSGVGSPFLNASALAHLAHLHHGSNPPTTSSSSSNSAVPGWPDWLGTAGLGPDAHQSLWSR